MYTRLIGIAAFAAITLTPAFADTVNFSSGTTPVTYTYISGQGGLDGTSGPAQVFTSEPYSYVVPGSEWISTTANGGDGNVGITNYTFTITLLPGESYSGTLTFAVDDNAGVLVNGTSIYGIDNTPDWYSGHTIDLLSSYFTAGTNTITIEDSNSGGGDAAVDFAGSLTGAAVSATPEPSSLLLLGTGLAGALGVARRRLSRA